MRGGVDQDPVEWSRDTLEIEGIDEVAGVADLATSAGTDEPPKLFVGGAAAPRRHLLELAEALEITVGADDFFDRRHAERADQLVLQIRDAYVEPELLHLLTTEVGAQTAALKRLAKDRHLAGIAESREPEAIPPRAEFLEEPSDAVRSSERNDPDPRPSEVESPPLSQRFDRDLVTYAFNDHERAGVIAIGPQPHRGHHTHDDRGRRAGSGAARLPARSRSGGQGQEAPTPV
jgi:hypothetical protein